MEKSRPSEEAGSSPAHRGKGGRARKKEDYEAQIADWEYCYCPACDRIRYRFDLEVTERGIRCSACGSSGLEAPAWVFCPHAMFAAATKCPRGGKGIIERAHRKECTDRCGYRQR